MYMTKLKQVLRNVAFLLAATMAFTACGGGGSNDPTPDPDPTPTPTPTPSTTESRGLVVFCMGSGTGLQDEMDKNITRIVEAASKVVDDNNKICIFYDRVYDANNKNHETYTRLTEVKKVDGRTKQVLVKEWNPSQTSTVDPTFMTEVLTLARQTMNVKQYGLVMSSHGGGWVPSDTYDQYVIEENKLNSQNDAKGASVNVPQTKFFGEDSGAFMEVPQLVQALKAAGQWQYVIFDACFMSSVEALYDLRSVAPYIVASPAEVMSGGFPYSTMVPLLLGKDNTPTSLENVCRAYMDSYKNSSATVALIQTDRLQALADIVKQINANPATVDANKLQGFEGFHPHLYFDFEQYIKALGANSDNTSLLAKFRTSLGEAVLFEAHTSSILSGAGSNKGTVKIDNCCGLTCHVPAPTFTGFSFDFVHEAWLKTDWAKAVTK